MSASSRAFHRHARMVLDHELRRARGPLRSLPEDRRLAVEELAAHVAAAVVDGVLDEARREPSLAGALASIYASRPACAPRDAVRVTD